ncbi:MerC domain-containing protein [uncultured Sphingomonas sp.]|uniref:MerC domain-containing protein n=1 Tax=uncultured Sphingomonas sp. TaxID=158754 RepID=UPI0035CC883F
MTAAVTRPIWLDATDRLAIGLSGLCLVHCLTTAVLVALASTVGGLLLHPAFHEIGLVVAILFGALALGRGAWEHGMLMPPAMGSLGLGVMMGAMTLGHGPNHDEALWTIVGVALLAFGHRLNRVAFD